MSCLCVYMCVCMCVPAHVYNQQVLQCRCVTGISCALVFGCQMRCGQDGEEQRSTSQAAGVETGFAQHDLPAGNLTWHWEIYLRHKNVFKSVKNRYANSGGK